VGSTDYASVSNILRSKNLKFKYNTASLLELESGSNDPTAFTMTMVFLSAIIGTKLSVSGFDFIPGCFGNCYGLYFFICYRKLLKNYSLESDGLYAVFMASIILVTYAATDLLGGNGYLALYILGIILAIWSFKGKRNIMFFFDGFTEIMQIGLFFILGLLSELPKFIAGLPWALAIMLL